MLVHWPAHVELVHAWQTPLLHTWPCAHSLFEAHWQVWFIAPEQPGALQRPLMQTWPMRQSLFDMQGVLVPG